MARQQNLWVAAGPDRHGGHAYAAVLDASGAENLTVGNKTTCFRPFVALSLHRGGCAHR
jgi:hypothetical protein